MAELWPTLAVLKGKFISKKLNLNLSILMEIVVINNMNENKCQFNIIEQCKRILYASGVNVLFIVVNSFCSQIIMLRMHFMNSDVFLCVGSTTIESFFIRIFYSLTYFIKFMRFLTEPNIWNPLKNVNKLIEHKRLDTCYYYYCFYALTYALSFIYTLQKYYLISMILILYKM